MEWEEVQNIWGAQNDKTQYHLDLEELHRRILSRKAKALHIANISEWLTILVNLGAGAVVLWTAITGTRHSFFMYILAAWMFVVAVLMVMSRIRRIAGSKRFDRSIQGELQHALSVAGYQVNFSKIMRWNIFVIGALILLGLWETGRPVWISICTAGVLLVAWYASGWEHQLYRRQKERLESLRDSLNG